MKERKTMVKLAQRMSSTPENVGMKGGDLPTRYFAGMVILSLTLMALPMLNLTIHLFKIITLIAAMSGTLLLMAGLVFVQKTHFAGIILIPVPLLMFWAFKGDSHWLAVAVGMVILMATGENIITKRCMVNNLFGVVSKD